MIWSNHGSRSMLGDLVRIWEKTHWVKKKTLFIYLFICVFFLTRTVVFSWILGPEWNTKSHGFRRAILQRYTRGNFPFYCGRYRSSGHRSSYIRKCPECCGSLVCHSERCRRRVGFRKLLGRVCLISWPLPMRLDLCLLVQALWPLPKRHVWSVLS